MGQRDPTTFQRHALASGLLEREQLDEAWAALCAEAADDETSPTDERLAEKLVELGWLNVWQSKQLLEGRTKFNLGPYRVFDSIGRGGMGQVFKARRHGDERVVAVKVLPLGKSTPQAVDSFLREIDLLASLDHPNLVRALDDGEDGNVCYLVTEYVPGADLRKLVRRNGPLRVTGAASIVSQVAAGLHHAHAKGLIHRDVKPGNVLVTPDGHAKLSDLGLAAPVEGDAESDPRFGKIVGTVDYISPDHVQSPWNPTPAWDVYSLGCTLYYAVTGKVPFPGGTAADKVRAHCWLRPLDPRRLNPGLSVEFVEVLAAMMAKEPEDRLQSAAEVIARLSPWSQAPSPDLFARPESPRTAGAQGRRTPGGSLPASMGAASEGAVVCVPEVAQFAPGSDDPSGESADTQSSLGSSVEGIASPAARPHDKTARPLPIFHPLVVLVLFPAALVGLVMAVAWFFGR